MILTPVDVTEFAQLWRNTTCYIEGTETSEALDEALDMLLAFCKKQIPDLDKFKDLFNDVDEALKAEPGSIKEGIAREMQVDLEDLEKAFVWESFYKNWKYSLCIDETQE
jgi:hypothetical protein